MTVCVFGQLGLSVLIVRPAPAGKSQSQSQSQSFGGRGVTVKEVLQVLRTVALPSPSPSASAHRKRDPNPLLRRAAHTHCNGIAASVLKSSPLLSGPLLETAFLGQVPSLCPAFTALHMKS